MSKLTGSLFLDIASGLITDWIYHRGKRPNKRKIIVRNIVFIEGEEDKASARLQYKDPQFEDLIFDIDYKNGKIRLSVYDSFISGITCLTRDWNGLTKPELAYGEW